MTLTSCLRVCRLFGIKCPQCFQAVGKNDVVMRVRNKIFHQECFRCVVCQSELKPGDEFALRDENLLYCKRDNESLERDTPPSCHDLGSPGSACSGGGAHYGNNNNSNIVNNNNNNSSVNNNNTISGSKDGKESEGKRGTGAGKNSFLFCFSPAFLVQMVVGAGGKVEKDEAYWTV